MTAAVAVAAPAAPQPEREPAEYTVRHWAYAGRPQLNLEALQIPIKLASPEGSEAGFRTLFGGAAFHPIPKLRFDQYDGWRIEFEDGDQQIFVRVKPTFGEDHDFTRFEARTATGIWRDFSSQSDLSYLLDIFAPCPF